MEISYLGTILAIPGFW